ncbi:hypothetical protein D5086_016252 [Populus alba]|uniref:Uncharacterized protein n=1 Tax=Populus alba TaxID=43335 RepID=A0ACC4BU44_POPAL
MKSEEVMNMGVEMSNLNFLKRKRKGVAIEPMNVSKSVDEQNYVRVNWSELANKAMTSELHNGLRRDLEGNGYLKLDGGGRFIQAEKGEDTKCSYSFVSMFGNEESSHHKRHKTHLLF